MENKYFILILLTLIISSCSEEKIVAIDNPTNEMLNFEIDGKPLKIKPLSLITYKIFSGEHELKVNDEKLTFEVPKKGKYLLNPTKDYYVMEEIIYGRKGWDYPTDGKKINNGRNTFNDALYKEVEDKLFLIDTITVNNYELIGFYKKTNEIVIRDIWDYGINQKAPDEIKKEMGGKNVIDIPTMGNFYIIKNKGKVKLYRLKDFIKKLTDNN